MPVTGTPDPAHASTSYVERSNLSIRMGNRRFWHGFGKIEDKTHPVMVVPIWTLQDLFERP